MASVDQPRAKRNYDAQYAKLLDAPYTVHKGTKHTMKECLGLVMAFCD